MAVVMTMQWDGVTPAQYDRVRDLVRWEEEAPSGAFFHVASFTPTGLNVTDVWESADDFQRFVDDRLMPGVKEAGIQGEPRVDIRPAHRVYSPHLTPVARS